MPGHFSPRARAPALPPGRPAPQAAYRADRPRAAVPAARPDLRPARLSAGTRRSVRLLGHSLVFPQNIVNRNFFLLFVHRNLLSPACVLLLLIQTILFYAKSRPITITNRSSFRQKTRDAPRPLPDCSQKNVYFQLCRRRTANGVCLHVEPEQHDVAVLHNVVLALRAHKPLLARGSHRAAGHQVIVGHDLGADEPAFKV